MTFSMTSNSDATNHLIQHAARGDPGTLGIPLVRREDRLRRMVALRMDRRLQGRIDASDVIQEAYLEASVRPGGPGGLRP
jgi:RNA polymerase sigma-70 factor (ECF subfamily)